LRLIFAGTPEFARVALAQLQAAGHEITLVLTQPDRPAGRGMKLQASAVKQFALAHAIPVAQPRSLRLDGKFPEEAAQARAAMDAAQADAMVVAAYGLILPQWVLGSFKHGCLNIHASLLPRWRGAAPIHRAIEAGDMHTGVTVMQMDAGLDTGDMLLVESQSIAADDSTASLHDKLAELGGRMMLEALKLAQAGELYPVKQPTEGVSYAHKIEKREAAIDWSQAAESIERRIRAFNPFPGAATALKGEAMKVWRSEIDSCSRYEIRACGTILSKNEGEIVVQCGSGALRLIELQRAGGKRMTAAEFLHGFALSQGDVLDAPPADAGT
jgi:methionyl-tRNA formyltransferase